LNTFRKVAETKYKLMPYIYAQAKVASEKGLPMMRALFVEFPEDPGAWQIENEYLLGQDLLVAPIFETGSNERNVYLPKGNGLIFRQIKCMKEDGIKWEVVNSQLLFL
jgi:alpha-D-xyloside xylohydrolase